MKSDSPRTLSSNNRNYLLKLHSGWHNAKCTTHVFTQCYEEGMVPFPHFTDKENVFSMIKQLAQGHTEKN